uniref:Nucleotidyltransferase domain protein n=1 Tax=Streptomyces sp. NRRL 30471 TaxID=996287 RepID=F2WUE1_9ACTN|nr:nucleotidyltransferase domain protein [Streptomyces sp. NRRL 30471]
MQAMNSVPRNSREPMLDPSVDAVLRVFLQSVDRLRPGLVEGLYLTGSIALGDFRQGRSDIDFVAVTAQRPQAADLSALQQAHTETKERHPRPYFDGTHVTWDDLAADFAFCPRVPYVQEGSFHAAGDFEINPVTWSVLAKNAVAVRGPASGAFPVSVDQAVLTDWARGNLDDYWRRWHAAHGKPLSLMGVAALGGWAPGWGVLGVSRLHYTVRTGEITSKAGAGAYALKTFGDTWEPIIEEALRVHRGESGSRFRTPFKRRRATLDFVSMVIDDVTR